MSPETELELDLDTPGEAGPALVSEHSLGWGVAWRLIRGALRSEAVPLLLVAILVGAASLTAAAGPAKLRLLADRALRQSTAAQSLDDRSLVLSVTVGAGGGGKDGFAEMGRRLRANLAPGLRRTFPTESHDYRAFGVPGSQGIAEPDGVPASLTLVDASATDHLIHYIEGVPPASAAPLGPHEVAVAVSRKASADLGIPLGARFKLGTTPPAPIQFGDMSDYAVVVGVFEQQVLPRLGPDDSLYWKQSPYLLQPELASTAGLSPKQYWAGAMVVSDAGLVELVDNQKEIQVRASWHETVDPRQLTAASAPDLRRQLAAFDNTLLEKICAPSFPGYVDCGGAQVVATSQSLTTGMRAVLDRFAADQLAADAIESFGVAGLLAVELAAVFAAARLVASRRARMVALYRARGASLRQAGAMLVIEAVLTVGPPTVLGWYAGGGSGRLWPPLLVAAFGIGVVPAAVLRRSGPGAMTARGDGVVLSKARRRTVEALVLVLAVAGVLSLRARGVAGTTSAGSIDPLMAAVPVLVGAVAALSLAKAMPRPTLAVARLIGRGRSTAGWLGVARAAERGQTMAVALGVLTLTLSGAVFSGVVLKTLAAGQVTAADRLGADAVVRGPFISPEAMAHLRALPEVTSVAGITVFDRTTTDDADGAQHQVRFLGLGPGLVPGVPGQAAAAADQAASDQATADQATATTASPGTPTDPIPVLVSAAAAQDFAEGVITVQFGRKDYTFQIVGTLPAGAPPAVLKTAVDGPGSDYVLLPAPTLAAVSDAISPSVVMIDGRVAGDQIRAALAGVAPPSVEVHVRAEDLDRMRGDGLVRSLRGVFIVCSLLGAAFAVLVIVLELAGTARERGKTVSFLRTMGLPARSAGVLTAVQLIPTAVAAALAGALLGTVLPWLLGPALSLTAFTDGYDAPIRTDLRVTLLLGLALLATVALAAAVEAVVSRRRRLSGVLRLGGD